MTARSKDFDVYGPFDVVREHGQCASNQRKFWHQANSPPGADGIARAIGCYLFCLRHGWTLTPWYVGRTNNKKGFVAEIFQEHKKHIYNECMKAKKGKPVIFLFPRYNGDRWSRAYIAERPAIAWLEKRLMGIAFERNARLANLRDMSFHRATTLYGILGQKRRGPRFDSVHAARAALFGR